MPSDSPKKRSNKTKRSKRSRGYWANLYRAYLDACRRGVGMTWAANYRGVFKSDPNALARLERLIVRGNDRITTEFAKKLVESEEASALLDGYHQRTHNDLGLSKSDSKSGAKKPVKRANHDTTTKQKGNNNVYYFDDAIASKLQPFARYGRWITYALATHDVRQPIDFYILQQLRTELGTIYAMRFGYLLPLVANKLTFEELEESSLYTGAAEIALTPELETEKTDLEYLIIAISQLLGLDKPIYESVGKTPLKSM